MDPYSSMLACKSASKRDCDIVRRRAMLDRTSSSSGGRNDCSRHHGSIPNCRSRKSLGPKSANIEETPSKISFPSQLRIRSYLLSFKKCDDEGGELKVRQTTMPRSYSSPRRLISDDGARSSSSSSDAAAFENEAVNERNQHTSTTILTSRRSDTIITQMQIRSWYFVVNAFVSARRRSSSPSSLSSEEGSLYVDATPAGGSRCESVTSSSCSHGSSSMRHHKANRKVQAIKDKWITPQLKNVKRSLQRSQMGRPIRAHTMREPWWRKCVRNAINFMCPYIYVGKQGTAYCLPVC
jgi:hypothetical protein